MSAIFILGGLAGCGGKIERVEDRRDLGEIPYSLYSMSGTDAFGREVTPVDGERQDKKKYVGMFYFTWLGQHPGGGGQTGIYDNSLLLEENPDALWDPNNKKESPAGAYHFWGEPMFGYYNSEDSWVIRKHMQMFIQAGVDFLVFDATNARAYFSVYDVIIDVLLDYQSQGWPIPKLTFYTNTDSRKTILQLYEYYYDSNSERYEKCRSLWFSPNGKPMIIGDRWNFDLDSESDQSILNSFDFRDSQWPNAVNRKNGFPWMSFEYPQHIHNGVVSVSVAQHTTIRMSNMDNGNWGRGYDRVKGINDPAQSRAGINYQSQWDTVFANDDEVEISFVTGWNEWIALKLVDAADKVYFVDTFNEEYSRDIEPMRGGYGDSFYMQTIQNVRRFKYLEPKHYLQQPKSFSDPTSSEEWTDVRAYRDFTGDAERRDFKGFYGNHLTNDTGRNDISEIRMTHDEENLYVRVACKEPVTPYETGDSTWMNLFLGTKDTGVYGDYRYVVNRSPDGNGNTSIDCFVSGMRTERVGTCSYVTKENCVYFIIPLKALGLKGKEVTLRFKATDDVALTEDLTCFYTDGDSAPLGRLSYTYGY